MITKMVPVEYGKRRKKPAQPTRLCKSKCVIGAKKLYDFKVSYAIVSIRQSNTGKEVLGSIPAEAARSLLVGSVLV